MMGVTHRPMASAWWLGGVLAIDTVSISAAHVLPINPLVAGIGAVIAPVFGAGRLSPDADVTWLRHLGHRKATHRPDTTAVYLTAISLALCALVTWLGSWPLGLSWITLAPITGWWSHLVGDAIFGKIPVSRRLVSSGWVGLGLDTDGLIERGTMRTDERTVTGLHRTIRVLPFAPTTTLLRGLTGVFYALILAQFVSAVTHGIAIG